ncbi:hypothetical protein A1507_09945 [Methylomonas koyamae]|uniref:Uncharacterized protein n=1 Tax=Methylomonas koyamae TaxID=702114 RepID=A0A177NLZ9_9GAMM|nr:hypothetical protein A1507_09945 [Methylomonas koyamae]
MFTTFCLAPISQAGKTFSAKDWFWLKAVPNQFLSTQYYEPARAESYESDNSDYLQETYKIKTPFRLIPI